MDGQLIKQVHEIITSMEQILIIILGQTCYFTGIGKSHTIYFTLLIRLRSTHRYELMPGDSTRYKLGLQLYLLIFAPGEGSWKE